LLDKESDPKPLYYRLKELLKGEVERDFEPNQRFYSVRELAGRHGVSAITVTRTVREMVEEGYLYARQGKGTFVSPRRTNRGARARRGLVISIPLTRTLDEVLLEPEGIGRDYLRGIADAGRENGAVVEFQLVPIKQTFDFILDLIERDGPNGVILYGSRDPVYPRLIDRAIDRGIAYVAFQPERGMTWDQVQRLNLNYVTTDQQEGLRQVTAHLIDLGHRRIAYWQHVRTGFTRLAGFRQAMATAGLEIEADLIQRDFDFDVPCLGALRGLIDQGVTALVTASDFIAMKVLREATEGGIEIPEQLSVTGFDDNPAAAHLSPPLTTVSVERYRTGREVAMALIRQHREPESNERHQILTPTRLVVRESTRKIGGRQ
jgi:DNA-binding LacI/PurR family transcriptional regulator